LDAREISIEQARVEGVAAEGLCSGFSAGILYEVCKGVAREQNIALTEGFSRMEILDMTPRYLRRSWTIWKPVSIPESMKAILSPEIINDMRGFRGVSSCINLLTSALVIAVILRMIRKSGVGKVSSE